ncbi:hypothetical protein L2E82_13900 [Cichorium intybus]|uniref:Uncharacterized protein n=1 Tax=Cichorium intybus TaxID=13427 RepID=A0ACB9EZS3_CICIN|nr:hypothetical protein L2E82_13900 [Cichorium intybus]
MYGVIRTYDFNYWAAVTIENHNPLGRLDNWNQTWDWMRDDFIGDINGTYRFARDHGGIHSWIGEKYEVDSS